MTDAPALLSLRFIYPLDSLRILEDWFAGLGVPFMVLAADGLGRSMDTPPDMGEVVFWPGGPEQASQVRAHALAGPVQPDSARETTEAVVDWVERWKVFFNWERISEGLAVGPPWQQPPQDVPLAVRIDPGQAFGTGTHPTTRLCMGLVEELLKKRQGASFLDLGCGSGVLCIAAAKLGAGRILGVDIDPACPGECDRNARLNEVSFDARVGDAPPKGQRFDILVANILPVPLLGLAPRLLEALEPDSALVLSGVPEEQAPTFLERFREAAHGAPPLRRQVVDGGWWAGLLEA